MEKQNPFKVEQHIIIKPILKSGFSIKELVKVFKLVGLSYGDGNLFWMLPNELDQAYQGVDELFCAEPYSILGYFHTEDWNNEQFTFPDFSLHFMISHFKDPKRNLIKMLDIAKLLSEELDAHLLNVNYQTFELEEELKNLNEIHEEILLKRIFGENE
jgi:FtsZ-interacting cell division protein ZipA